MKYFFDTEFIEDFHKPLFGKRRHYIDLISIGIVAEDDREYYAISNEFDVKYVWNKWQYRYGQGDRNNTDPREYWLRENVLRPIYEELILEEDKIGKKANSMGFASPNRSCRWTLNDFKYLIKRYGKSTKQIAQDIESFCHATVKSDNTLPLANSLIWDKPEFYAYYADYDWVLFCSLFGRMLDLPDGFPMYCKDVKQMVDDKVRQVMQKHIRPNTEQEFKANLTAMKLWKEYPKETNSHNALADAKWNRELYKFITTLNM